MPKLTISLGLHAVLSLTAAFFWVLPMEDETGLVSCRLRAAASAPLLEPERRADEHPPIHSKNDPQPDAEIINDAEAVVVNSIPTNIDASRADGEALDFLRSARGSGWARFDVLGLGAAEGRRGTLAANFG